MNSIQEAENPLSRSFTMSSLLKFAFPTILMMLFMGLYTVTDTIFVARFVNTDALSAMNIVCPVVNLIVGLGTMLATGGSAVIARKMGAGEHVRASQDFTLIVAAGGVLGVLIAVLGAAFADRLIWSLGASERLFPYCKAYLFVLLCFTPASIIQVLFQNLIVTAGCPGIGMVLGTRQYSAGLHLHGSAADGDKRGGAGDRNWIFAAGGAGRAVFLGRRGKPALQNAGFGHGSVGGELYKWIF